MAQPPFDVTRAHRWFAVELNNLAWDFVEAQSLSPDDAERMIHAAHGACFHWLHAGDDLNHLRAQVLLATAYARASLGDAAVRHTKKGLALSEQVGDKQTAFDIASMLGCAVAAYKLTGEAEAADIYVSKWRKAIAAVDDANDRALLGRLYRLESTQA